MNKTKKKILIKGKEIKELTLEEALEQFKNLAYKMAIKYCNQNTDYREELYQEAMIKLIKVYEEYSIDKNVPFFSFAKVAIRRHYILLNKRNKEKNYTFASLHNTVKNDDHEEEYINLLIDDSMNIENEAIHNIMNKTNRIYGLFKEYDKSYIEIIKLLERGMCQSEIARIQNVTKNNVNQKMKHIRNLLKQNMEMFI